MSAILIFLAAAATAGGDQPPARTQGAQAPALESSDKARERATYESLLSALRQKRAEIVRAPLAVNDERRAEARRYALEFLDGQIERIKKEMEQ